MKFLLMSLSLASISVVAVLTSSVMFAAGGSCVYMVTAKCDETINQDCAPSTGPNGIGAMVIVQDILKCEGAPAGQRTGLICSDTGVTQVCKYVNTCMVTTTRCPTDREQFKVDRSFNVSTPIPTILELPSGICAQN